jgi:hypothetical protein
MLAKLSLMKEIKKGSKVKVTSFCGMTKEPDAGENYRIIGSEGFVTEILNKEWLLVHIPTHRYHSKDGGGLFRHEEVEAV